MTKAEHLAAINARAPRVHAQVREKSAERIAALDSFMHGFSGTIIAIKRIWSGQTRPYGDSIDECVIFCYQPNALTTGEPGGRLISREDVLALARIFIGPFVEGPSQLGHRSLEFLEPESSPGGIGEDFDVPEGKATCWRIRLREPWND